MVGGDGSVPTGLALEVAATRYAATRITRGMRPDVVRHFGLQAADYGFDAEFDIGVDACANLADARVVGGGDGLLGGVPLRLAPSVSIALRDATHARKG